ncbi:uncharacterized protein [Zea mays]|uniref:uncharacterized protein n=1 Tax=Zea mays TaxID=4577 RepID=UPI0016527F27|nr:uncharacterized protein LOC103646625 [Zea mays]
MDIWFQICSSIISSCQLGRRHVYFHSCAPILASSIVSFWCTADLVCVKCIRLSQVGDFRLCSLQPRRRRRRRSVHGGHLLHGRIDATARYGYLELAIEQMAKTADASNALNHGLHYLRSTGNACAARVLLWWGWENSDAHAANIHCSNHHGARLQGVMTTAPQAMQAACSTKCVRSKIETSTVFSCV